MSIFTKKDVESVYDQLKEKFDAYNASLAASQEALEAAQARVAGAKADMEAAADEDDPAAFAVAKASLSEAETAVEMEKMRIDRITAKGAVSNAEADDACTYYKRRMHEVDVEAAKRICDLLEQIVEIDKAALTEANKLSVQYAGVLRLLDRTDGINMMLSSPSRVHAAMSQKMCIVGDTNIFGNVHKLELYRLAGRKV